MLQASKPFYHLAAAHQMEDLVHLFLNSMQLNGSSYSELLAAFDNMSEVWWPHSLHWLQVIAPRQAGHAGHAFAQAPVLKEVSLPQVQRQGHEQTQSEPDASSDPKLWYS